MWQARKMLTSSYMLYWSEVRTGTPPSFSEMRLAGRASSRSVAARITNTFLCLRNASTALAIGATELALKGEAGSVEKALAAAEGVDVLGPPEVDGRYYFV